MTGPLPVSPPCGVLNLNKPSGMTSRDVVDLVSRPLKKAKVKVGHAGTLDPLASGVLVLCLGAATRLIESVQAMPKTYRAEIRLGATSDSLDADGQITAVENPPIPDETAVRAALAAQVGTIDQVPPQVSALKVGGRRAYDLAREGKEVALAARPVQVYRIELLSYAWPRLEILVECGSGTYIRSIARDVGEALGCGGLIDVLVRTRIGSFLLEEAIDPTGRDIAELLAHLRPMADALGDLPRLVLTPEQVAAVGQGKALVADRVAGAAGGGGEVALLGPDGSVVAIGEYDALAGRGLIRPRRVLAGANPG
ncbi:tRNA pseudouridine(55) synthase TruB [Tundrisphaera sp. TA3]|uniref:tRNA pseudouridine(55) synthase TruB n=1 Tax=Tundrisphaera sp. TA3 TaxID=3435775 RepID=UPI003EBBC42D